MIPDGVARYYAELDSSPRPRKYFVGRAPDDDLERWLFEVVEDNGELIALRQLTVGADGTRRAYSPQHLEDGWGFLTDQPITDADQLDTCSREEFYAVWHGAKPRDQQQ